MRMADSNKVHLTYCTNIHPGESWSEIRWNIETYVLAVKERVAPTKAFGVGLRLSATAADELKTPENLKEFQAFLSANNLYIFTINGFPHGKFHGTHVKEKVYLPDWRDEERLRYTKVLADILAALLPLDPTLTGSISTVPGAFKPEVHRLAEIEQMTELFLEAAIYFAELKAKTGKTISLALEPEPCCFLETVDETIAFFRDHLFSSSSVQQVASQIGMPISQAKVALQRHLGVCLDLCHAAVEYEEASSCIEALRNAGIYINKMQISAGLRLPVVSPEKVQALRQFDDHVYLHQVVERTGSTLVRYFDLGKAMRAFKHSDGAREWRIHFHVPIFLADLGAFHSTQGFIREVLEIHRTQPVSPHLEVETYTWGVTPPQYQNGEVVHAICRELEWVQGQL